MAVATKIDPIAVDLSVIINQELSPKARSEKLAAAARDAISEAQATNRSVLGRVPPHTVYVDGQRGAALESVKPDGHVVAEFELVDEVFAWIGDQLVIHSPVRSGRYSRSHVFTADGDQVEPGADVPVASEYVFVNTQPYGRKVERGLSAQAPDGVYQVVATLANRRFGNIARIRFGYRTPLFGGIHDWASNTRMASPGRNGAKRAEWLRNQPAIIITVR